MKILFVSMPSIHVIRWIENLSQSGHELFWFDILDRGAMQTSVQLHQITGWKKRKLPYLKGEFFLRKKMPFIYNALQSKFETTVDEYLKNVISEIQPDLVHSFEMQHCSYPIIKTMQHFPNLKWLYNCWGNDLFYYQNLPKHKSKINKVLSRVNYMSADCSRDISLAKLNGFKGVFLDVVPGGGGYDLSSFSTFIEPQADRKIIIVKGYHHLFGRALNVIKALEEIAENLKEYTVVVFGANKIVENYISDKKLPYKVYDRHGLQHDEVLRLMGQSLIYVGNNISDGMPNTLLEAMIMGAFPIQSNPGNATAEIITNGENGYLIENPLDSKAISELILKALQQPELIRKAFELNQKLGKERLDYSINQQKIIALYNQIENNTCV
jgi:glycosyltransferase involved in cell wall biosynthesis